MSIGARKRVSRSSGPAKAANAASVASLMLTTECLVAERPKDEKSSGGGGGHAGHGHGDF